MKTLLQMIFLGIMFVSLSSFSEELYETDGSNTYNVYQNGKLAGVIQLKPFNQLVYTHGADGKIVLYGKYTVEEIQTKDGVTKTLVANLNDTQNTTIWVDSAIIKIDLTKTKVSDLKSPKGTPVRMNIYLDGSPSAQKKDVTLVQDRWADMKFDARRPATASVNATH